MQKEISILLDKMGIDYTNSSFFDSLKLERLVVDKESGNWNFYLLSDKLPDIDSYLELEKNKNKIASNIYYNMESTGQNDTGKGVGLSSSELNKMVAKGLLPDYGLDLPLPDIYDTSSRPLYSPAFVTFQVGISGEDSAGIYQDLSFTIEGLKDLCYLGLDDEKSLEKIDEMIASISSKELELGALQNRLESVLEQVGVAYDNLVSTQSTIRDADIAEESSAYIRNQILQQAATTLMATANQTPAIALQLL